MQAFSVYIVPSNCPVSFRKRSSLVPNFRYCLQWSTIPLAKKEFSTVYLCIVQFRFCSLIFVPFLKKVLLSTLSTLCRILQVSIESPTITPDYSDFTSKEQQMPAHYKTFLDQNERAYCLFCLDDYEEEQSLKVMVLEYSYSWMRLGIHEYEVSAILFLVSAYQDRWQAMFPLIFKVCVRITFPLCNILPGLICIWNDMYEVCAKTFFEGTFMCAQSFRVCTVHTCTA